jgi:hypothetical protein
LWTTNGADQINPFQAEKGLPGRGCRIFRDWLRLSCAGPSSALSPAASSGEPLDSQMMMRNGAANRRKEKVDFAAPLPRTNAAGYPNLVALSSCRTLGLEKVIWVLYRSLIHLSYSRPQNFRKQLPPHK